MWRLFFMPTNTLSGDATDTARDEFLAAGVQVVLAKPVRMEDLRVALAQLLALTHVSRTTSHETVNVTTSTSSVVAVTSSAETGTAQDEETASTLRYRSLVCL